MSICVFCNYLHNNNEICGDYRCHELLSKYLNKYLKINIKNYLDEIKFIKKKIIYKCENCCKTFGSKLAIDYHIENEVCKKDKNFQCEKCGKVFSEKKNLQYHANNNVCEKNIVNDNNIINNTTNNTSNNTTNNTTNTSNVANIANTSNIANQQNIQTQNNTNNNIQINVNTNEPRKPPIEMIPFRDVSYKISTKKYLEYANNPEQAIRKFVKDEHLNPNKPERMNVLNTNPRSNRVQLFDYDEDFNCRWQTKDKNDISELLFDRGVNILFFAKMMLASAGIKLDPKKETKLNAKIKEYENDGKLKKKYVDMISDLTYDYREMVGANKKSIDQEILTYKQLVN